MHVPAWAWSSAVIAGFVGSAITLLGTLGRDWFQHRRDGRASRMRDQSAAYSELLARSLSMAIRAETARSVIRFRSGIQEGLSVMLYHRKPLDLFAVHDWLDTDIGPFHNAWSRVWMVGSQEAIQAADHLVNTCGDLLKIATDFDAKRQRVRATVRGITWNEDEVAAYDQAVARFAEARVAFARLTRTELGQDAVIFALERARMETPRVPVTRAGQEAVSDR